MKNRPEFKIEKDIPIAQSFKGRFTVLAERMNIGDSILLSGLSESNALRSALNSRGFSMIAREQLDGQTRCWKIEKKKRAQ